MSSDRRTNSENTHGFANFVHPLNTLKPCELFWHRFRSNGPLVNVFSLPVYALETLHPGETLKKEALNPNSDEGFGSKFHHQHIRTASEVQLPLAQAALFPRAGVHKASIETALR